MGDFNLDAPAVLGIEASFTAMRNAVLSNPGQAFAMRVRPGAVSANELHSFLLDVAGQPGLAMELNSVLAPAVTTTGKIVPASDSDAVVTNWLDQGGAAVNAVDVDEPYNTAEYARNSIPLTTTEWQPLLLCGNSSGLLTGRRVLAVHIGCSVTLFKETQTGAFGYVIGLLQDNGVQDFLGRYLVFTNTGRPTWHERVSTWYFDPFTKLPWVTADVDDYLDPTDNELFGVATLAKANTSMLRVNGFWLEVEHCAENRQWAFYTNQQPRVGWTENAATSILGAMSASTYYYLVVSCPYAKSGSTAVLPVFYTQGTPLQTDPTSNTLVHRGIYELALQYPAGVPTSVPAITPGLLPALIGNSGTINSQSQPYTRIIPAFAYSAALLPGQQITTPAAGTITVAGIRAPVRWTTPGALPTAPLIFELRRGVGAISGGGTLVATFTWRPDQSDNPYEFPFIPIDGGSAIVLLNSTQYHLLAKSSAPFPTSWYLIAGDTRSDLLGSGTTLNEVEKASFAGPGATDGQTDSYVVSGAALPRYDLSVELYAAPAPPTGLTVTALPATTVERVQGVDGYAPSGLPPRIALSWTNGLTTTFRAVRVLRRLHATPARPWKAVLERRVDTLTETPALVADAARFFVDYLAGWSVLGAEYAEGWDYAVQNQDNFGVWSPISSAVSLANEVVASDDSWLCSNSEWWLQARVRSVPTRSGGGGDDVEEWHALGRGTIARVPADPPVRRYSLRWADLNLGSERSVRRHRQAALSGRTFALLEYRGDRILGVPTLADTSREGGKRETQYDCELIVIEDEPVCGEVNVPCEVVHTAGSSIIGSVPHATDLDPASTPFTALLVGRLAGSGTSDYALSKGQLGTGQGWALRTTAVAGQAQVVVTGAGGTVTAEHTDATLFGAVHCWWLDLTASELRLILDDDEEPLDVTPNTAGAIASTRSLLVAANNDGADAGAAGSFMSLAWRAIGIWPGGLDDAQRIATARYVLGYYDERAAGGSSAFYDAADSRSWDEARAGVSDIGAALQPHPMTLSAGYYRRGRPADLYKLDRWD